MKNDQSDRRWIIFIIVLLGLEMGWLLIDFGVIDISIFSKNEKISGNREAGYVIKSKDQLKRRGGNSLIWEPAAENEVLYFQDSILTLAQSTASLHLKDKTELQLSENTLVTIEEPDPSAKAEIRLRFSRGDLKARNPSSKTAIQGDDWIVNLESGSEISMRKNQDSYEFEVLSGNGTIETKSGSQPLEKSKVLQLGSDLNLKTINKIESIRWDETALRRIYIFSDQISVDLKWTGPANEIIIQGPQRSEIKIPLKDLQQVAQVNFQPGSYQLRLATAAGLSEAKSIEVWKAPKIFLKYPLSRDRVDRTKPLEFLWTSDTLIKNYKIEITKKNKLHQSEVTAQTAKSFQFTDEGEYKWSVSGFDSEGFSVPATNESDFFIQEILLEAPQLKVPTLIEEKKDTNENSPNSRYKFKNKLKLFWNLFFPEAIASADRYEISFEWSLVAGADIYTLEVSETADFSNPLLVKVLRKNSYKWKNAENKKYYWRVASGHSSGRLGLFSEPMQLQLTALKKIVLSPGVAKPVLEIIASPKPEPPPIVVAAPAKSMDFGSAKGIAWQPMYKMTSVAGDQESKILLNGGAPLSFQIKVRTHPSEETYYALSASHTQQTWKPNPPEKFPLQPSIDIAETILNLEKSHTASNFRYGVSIRSSYLPERMTNKVISVKAVSMAGVRVSWAENTHDSFDKDVFAIGANFSKELQQLNFDYEKKYYFSNSDRKIRYFFGGAGNLILQKDFKQGFQGNLNFLLGVDQF